MPAAPAPPERRFRVAGFWRRTASAAVDALLVGPFMALAAVVTMTLGGRPIRGLGELGPAWALDLAVDGGGIGLAALLLALLVGCFYMLAFHALRGQSPGQRLLGMRVIDVFGESPAPLRAVVRTALGLVSVLGFGLGFLWIGFDRERRALHDWLAGTYVVEVGRAPATVSAVAV